MILIMKWMRFAQIVKRNDKIRTMFFSSLSCLFSPWKFEFLFLFSTLSLSLSLYLTLSICLSHTIIWSLQTVPPIDCSAAGCQERHWVLSTELHTWNPTHIGKLEKRKNERRTTAKWKRHHKEFLFRNNFAWKIFFLKFVSLNTLASHTAHHTTLQPLNFNFNFSVTCHLLS